MFRNLEKFEKFLFYFFVFSIPFQTRKILFLSGNRFIEWNSGFLYFTDLLIVGILFLAILRGGIKFKKVDIFLGLFFLIAGLSLITSQNIGLSVYQLIKLAEFILLFLYIRANLEFLGINRILKIFVASGVFQALIAIAQFLKQGSLGLKFIEAGIFVPGASGVATFISNGEKVMQAYGSFSHPNVLAGFILLTIFCLYELLINPKFKAQISNQIQMTKILKFIPPFCLFVLIFGLFLTFSRTAIFIFIVISLIMFLWFVLRSPDGSGRRRTVSLFAVFLFSVIISTAILFPYLKARFFEISFEEQAIDLRFFYNKIAISIIKEKPLMGIGIGNFVWYSQNYPAFLKAANKMLNLVGKGENDIPKWIYQPVHNIYLLIASEIGIVGLVVFLIMLIVRMSAGLRIIRIVNPLFFLMIGFLILGLTDHYFWTLQQGGLMFWLGLGLLSAGQVEH